MYDEALLQELTELENTVRFDSFDFNDAYALGSALRAAGEKAPKPIAVRIVLDGMILYQSFLPGTDATNNNWMDKKQRTVQLTGTTSLRAAVERELYGAKAPWQHGRGALRLLRRRLPAVRQTASSAVRRSFPVCRI